MAPAYGDILERNNSRILRNILPKAGGKMLSAMNHSVHKCPL